MNKRHPYRDMEREFVTFQISLRELCRKHSISAHSLVTVQAKKGRWQEKHEQHEQYRAKADESFMNRHAARQADRVAEVRDHALEAIDEAITKCRSDMQATEQKRIDGEWVEVPVMRLKPKEVALLLDRLLVLFEKPSIISQRQDLTVTSEATPDALREFIERARGLGEPSRMDVSPLPRTRRLDD